MSQRISASDERVRAVFADESEGAREPTRAPGLLARPTRTSTRLPLDWRRVIATLLAACVALAVLGVLAWRLSVPAPREGLATQPDATPSGGDDQDDPDQGVPVPTLSAIAWQGAALPISSVDGPLTLTDTRSYGFTRTPIGAALAAVHISTHVDPYTGPDVFTPAIRDQVIGGDTERLLRATSSTYERIAKQVGVESGRPILAPTGHIVAWRIPHFRSHNRVDLLVDRPDGSTVVYRVPVAWHNGDWRVVLGDHGSTFEMTEQVRGRFTEFTSDA